MKAKEIIKKEKDLSKIHKEIEEANESGHCKIFIPHFIVFSENSKLKLIENGFKVYKGEWDGIMKDVYIIEW